jgi:hypothetical protein
MDARPRELRKSSEILAEIMAKYPTRLETPGAPPSPPTQEEMTIVPPSYARQLLVDQPRTTSTEKAVVRARVARTAFVHACRPPFVAPGERTSLPLWDGVSPAWRRCDASHRPSYEWRSAERPAFPE